MVKRITARARNFVVTKIRPFCSNER